MPTALEKISVLEILREKGEKITINSQQALTLKLGEEEVTEILDEAGNCVALLYYFKRGDFHYFFRSDGCAEEDFSSAVFIQGFLNEFEKEQATADLDITAEQWHARIRAQLVEGELPPGIRDKKAIAYDFVEGKKYYFLFDFAKGNAIAITIEAREKFKQLFISLITQFIEKAKQNQEQKHFSIQEVAVESAIAETEKKEKKEIVLKLLEVSKDKRHGFYRILFELILSGKNLPVYCWLHYLNCEKGPKYEIHKIRENELTAYRSHVVGGPDALENGHYYLKFVPYTLPKCARIVCEDRKGKKLESEILYLEKH